MLPAPPALQAPPSPQPPVRLADLLGVPYVEDGVTDAEGRWVTFAEPGRSRPTPGLNCSGFVVEAARRLLGFAGTPAEAARDRRGDSGPGAKAGRDWDFGWDMVLNLSEGRPRRWLLPGGPKPVSGLDAASFAGAPALDLAAWQALFAVMDPGKVYLANFLRPRKALPPLHHHAGLLLKDRCGTVWLYQTLPKGRVHRLALSTPPGFARFTAMFGSAARVLVLEVDPPAGGRSAIP